MRLVYISSRCSVTDILTSSLYIALRTACLARTLVEILEIAFAGNDGAHGRNVETEETSTNDGDRRNGVHIPDLKHLVVVSGTRCWVSEVGVVASESECSRGTKDWISGQEGCGGVGRCDVFYGEQLGARACQSGGPVTRGWCKGRALVILDDKRRSKEDRVPKLAASTSTSPSIIVRARIFAGSDSRMAGTDVKCSCAANDGRPAVK